MEHDAVIKNIAIVEYFYNVKKKNVNAVMQRETSLQNHKYHMTSFFLRKHNVSRVD